MEVHHCGVADVVPVEVVRCWAESVTRSSAVATIAVAYSLTSASSPRSLGVVHRVDPLHQRSRLAHGVTL